MGARIVAGGWWLVAGGWWLATCDHWAMRGLGVDVGGTFTDLVFWDGDSLSVGKTSSTADQSDGVLEGARALLGDQHCPLLVHGTTVATNALLERAGAEVALITDPGFEDLIEIGRQHRPSLYDSDADRAAPLVERSHRIGWDGDAVDRLRRLAPGAVAVALRDSYRAPEAEQEVLAAVEHLGVPVVASHQVTPEFREFERTSTTVVNAYLHPRVSAYLGRLRSRISPGVADRVMVMRSSGGLITPERAGRLSASILLSGPAGGVVASAALGRAMGLSRVISFDMGGTSTDVCRIEDGRPEVGYEREIDGLVVRMPSVAVHTVGAGGGSIAWVDEGGALRVGPQSAGALPGPAAYGRGGSAATVTDAHAVLGRLSGTLADGVELDIAAAREAVAGVARQVDMDVETVALGIVEVVESTMERAVRTVSVEEGADPSAATLVAFGGAGGLHAVALARRLEMAGVLIPPQAGVFSALGLLLTPPRADHWRTVLTTDMGEVERTLDELAAAAASELRASVGTEPVTLDVVVDVRYTGQAHETPVPYRRGDGWDALEEHFHEIHAERNGFARVGDPVEVVAVRVAAIGEPALTWDDLPVHRASGPNRLAARRVTTATGPVEVDVWWRPGMAPGDVVMGPCIVADGQSTTWLDPGDRGLLLGSGALEVTW
jgi:N-methylhydantoinase A